MVSFVDSASDLKRERMRAVLVIFLLFSIGAKSQPSLYYLWSESSATLECIAVDVCVDLGIAQEGTVDQCKASCDSDPDCDCFTRKNGFCNKKKDCTFRKRHNSTDTMLYMRPRCETWCYDHGNDWNSKCAWKGRSCGDWALPFFCDAISSIPIYTFGFSHHLNSLCRCLGRSDVS